MDIDSTNFEAQKKAILDDIENADLLSIDTELTGLFLPGEPRSLPTDSVSTTYSRMRQSCMQFALVQFGITTFTFDSQTSSYVVRPYNFYLFPRSTKGIKDKCYLFSNSAVDFLLQYKFDFNRCFEKGISFVTRKEEEDFARFQQKSKTNAATIEDIPLGRHEATVQTICDSAEKWISTEASKSFTVQADDGFLRRLLYQEIPKRILSGIACSSNKSQSGHSFVITRQTEEERIEALQLLESKMQKDRETAIGFRAIFDKISAHQKLVVSHNGLYDLCHVFQKLSDDLPENIDDFKEKLHAFLPRVIDTKYMATQSAFGGVISSTALGDVFSATLKEPFTAPNLVIPQGFTNYSTVSAKPHEAGYDSYMTGCAFLRMLYLMEHKSLAEGVDLELPLDILHCQSYANVLNRVPLSTLQGFVTLDGPDVVPVQENLFLISEFPSEWKTRHILNLFEGFGPVKFRWLSDTSVLVTVESPENVKPVMNLIVANPKSEARLFKAALYQQQQESKTDNSQQEDLPNAKRPKLTSTLV